MSGWIAAVLVPIIGSLVAWWTVRSGRKGDRENAMIDQLQEDRITDRKRVDELDAKVDKLQQQVWRLLSRDTQWSIHADRVEAQVRDLGQEPHPRPEQLRDAAIYTHTMEAP